MLSVLDGESVVGIIHLLRPVRSDSSSTLTDYLLFLEYCEIDMLTLLLYLIVQCQKKLLNDSLRSPMDLISGVLDTMNLILHVHNKVYPADDLHFFDRLILKLIYRSLRLFIETRSDSQ